MNFFRSLFPPKYLPNSSFPCVAYSLMGMFIPTPNLADYKAFSTCLSWTATCEQPINLSKPSGKLLQCAQKCYNPPETPLAAIGLCHAAEIWCQQRLTHSWATLSSTGDAWASVEQCRRCCCLQERLHEMLQRAGIAPPHPSGLFGKPEV